MNLAKPVTASEISADGFAVDDVAAVAYNTSVRTIRRHGQCGKLVRRAIATRGGVGYEYLLDNAAIVHYTEMQSKSVQVITTADPIKGQDSEDCQIERMPKWQRERVMRITQMFLDTKGMSVKDQLAYLQHHGYMHEGETYSLGHFYELKAQYKKKGISGIMAGWGSTSRNTSTVCDDWYEYYKRPYLTDRRPSPARCWALTLGYAAMKAKMEGEEFDASEFPSVSAFMRRLKRELPATVIKYRREGRIKWQNEDGMNLNRCYDNMVPNQCWVSDHVQSDVNVTLPDGRVVCLWITVWMDVATCKFLAWKISTDGPSSTNILIAFKRAAKEYGIPRGVILDRGKDYRCRSLMGGIIRETLIKVEPVTKEAKGLFASLEIVVHSAIAYNAKAKICERMFSRVHREFDRLYPGYRGVNVTVKPENLAKEIRSGLIMTSSEFTMNFDTFILEVFNKWAAKKSKVLRGKSPDQRWGDQYAQAVATGVVRYISNGSLAMFCTQIYKPRVIRNSAYMDDALGLKYQDTEWMPVNNGVSVIMRRDDEDIRVAWFFDAKTDKYLGEARTMEFPSAVADTPVEKKVVADQMAKKRQLEKTIAALGKVDPLNNADIVPQLIEARKAIDRVRNYSPVHTEIAKNVAITDMDRMIAEEKRRKRAGTYDNLLIIPDAPKKEEPMDDVEFYDRLCS